VIINTASIQAFEPAAATLDYAASKGAVVTFTKGLAAELAKRGIRVNAVAPGDVQPAELAHTYVFLANDSPTNQLATLAQMKRPKFVLCDTRDMWIHEQRAALEEVMRKTDGIVLNDGEARLLSGESNLIRAAHRLHALGSRIAIVKKGEHGAFLSIEGKGYALPAYPVPEVVDPTGAGDSFAGGLMGYVAHADRTDFATLKHAMLAGTITASFCVEDFSLDRLKSLDRPTFERRLAELKEFVTL